MYQKKQKTFLEGLTNCIKYAKLSNRYYSILNNAKILKGDKEMAKKTFTKILCLALVALMMLSCFIACVKEPDNPDESDEQTKGPEATNTPSDSDSDGDDSSEVTDNTDPSGYLKDDLPDNLDFGGKTFTFLAWGDVEHPEFGIEDDYDASNITLKALYTRTKNVESRLNITIEFLYEDGDSDCINSFADKVKLAVNGDKTYDAIASYSRTTAVCATKGYLYNLNSEDCSYINFDKPWWPDSLIKETTVKGNLYFASGDISPNALYMMYTCFVNDKILEEYHSDMVHPQELVESNQWTYDKFIEYCQNVYSDLDGNQEKNADKASDSGDLFGYMSSSNIHIDPWFYGTGALIVEKDANGDLKVSDSFTGDKVKTTLTKLNNLLHSSNYGIQTGTDVLHQVNFRDEKLLFCMDRARISFKVLEANGDLKYSILPCPTYDENTPYVTVIGNPVTLYGLPVYAKVDGTVEMGAAVLEALASECYRTVTPVIFETLYKLRYSQDDIDARMFDIIRSSISFDIGRIFDQDLGSKQTLFRNAVKNNSASSWTRDSGLAASTITKSIKKLQPKLEGSFN